MLCFRTFLLLAVLFFMPVVAFSSPSPSLDIADTEFDFGEVLQGEKVTHTFNFVNSGDAPLIIDRLKSSCGCTAALISAKNIAAGEKGTIKATFDSSRFRGSVRKVIFLYSNLPGAATTQFVIKGVVRSLVEFSPQQLDFDEVKEGREKQLSVILKNTGEKVLKIENLRASNTALSATTEVKQLLPGVETELSVFARPLKETVHLRGYILIRTDNKVLGEIRIPVRGYVVR